VVTDFQSVKTIFMKPAILSVMVALAAIAVFSGCGKSSEAPSATPPSQGINATDFRPAFATATPEIKTLVDQVMMNIQASLFPAALQELGKLAANPALNEAQKKAVSELTEQVKAKIAAIAGPPK
jgi:uncharacterized lipoprotein YajG